MLRMFRFSSIELENKWHNTPLGAVIAATGCKFQVAYQPVFSKKTITHTIRGIELFSVELDSYSVGGLYHLCPDMKVWANRMTAQYLTGISLPTDCKSWELASFVAKVGLQRGLEMEFNNSIYTLIIQDSW